MPKLPIVLLCALTATLFFCDPVEAQERGDIPEFQTFGKPAHPSDAADIHALIRAYKKAWGQQDTRALMALHTADNEWINAYGRMFRGTTALGEFLSKRLFPAFDPAVSAQEVANMTTISTRYVGDSAAVVHLYTEGRRGPSRARDEGAAARRTHIHLVLERRGKAWKIVHSAIMDPR